jgi:hypothetical protein
MAYYIVIENLRVGVLSDDGKIVSDNPFLPEIGDVEVVIPEGDQAGVLKRLRPGDRDYIPGVVDVLEEAGYGVVPVT